MNREDRAISMIELVNMEFYSYHGHFHEEQIIGNKFIVNFSAECDVFKAGESDLLEDAVNYQELYNIIKEEMEIPSKLLENVALRIAKRVKMTYPQVGKISISVAKMNPPIGGKVEASRVAISY
ncbi:MAG: dihydroneopterin aldolase [Bacteroidetes bacterium 41-46]|jgi:dihydroneopterin aldolase|nr:MAG: dihydroneopterin aldolase [Bacteroidetes bacterium 41-46]